MKLTTAPKRVLLKAALNESTSCHPRRRLYDRYRCCQTHASATARDYFGRSNKRCGIAEKQNCGCRKRSEKNFHRRAAACGECVEARGHENSASFIIAYACSR